MKNKILILSGDPNSVNSEIISKSWKKISKSLKRKIYFISNYNLLKAQFKKNNYNNQILKVKNIDEETTAHKLKIIDLNLNFTNPFKVKKKNASKFIINSLNYAHRLCIKTKKIKGIINCSIDKKLLNKKKIGVTEYLAKKNKIKKNSEVMLIRNDKLSVCPITTHIDIKEIKRRINKKVISEKIKTINKWFLKSYKKKPKIGVLGLNPHNAEYRKDSEEKKIIIPTILALKKKGYKIEGPLVADTLFIYDYRNYDVIVGMYHDQVIAPFKTLFKFNAINTTLGLEYLRVSPDHGTAKDLIGKNKANAESLISAIKFVNKFGK